MRTIPLTNSDQIALVDDSDYEYLIQWAWQLHTANYAYRSTYAGNYHSKSWLMHNVIMDSKGIDHIDSNKLNNQRSNLRVATKSQNAMNSRKLTKRTSKYKGVSWCKTYNKWSADITINYKKKFLGYFNNEIDAAKAYNAKAIELFGDFARINEL